MVSLGLWGIPDEGKLFAFCAPSFFGEVCSFFDLVCSDCCWDGPGEAYRVHCSKPCAHPIVNVSGEACQVGANLVNGEPGPGNGNMPLG